MNSIYGFTVYVGKLFKLVYLPIAFAPLYICSLVAKPVIVFSEYLSALKVFTKKLGNFHNPMKVSLFNEIKTTSPKRGCYVNQDRKRSFQKIPILESGLSKNQSSLLTARKQQ